MKFPSPAWPTLRPDLVRAVVLAILVGLIWCTLYNRWTVESWQTPLTYLSDPEKGDVIGFFAEFRAAEDGHISPFTFTNIPELGAPYVANWDDVPVTEKPLICLVGCLAMMMGLFAAANFAAMLGHILAAISFYAACRILNCSWIWSFAGGVVFGFAHYAFAHELHHLPVLYYWHIPLCLVIVFWLVHGEGISLGTERFWFALLVALMTGVQNVYYTNMFAQFVLLAGLLQGWRHGWRALLPAVSIVTVTMGAFLLMNVNTFAYHVVHGGNPGAVLRNYQWMEVYGMKLVDLVVPPPDHAFPPFAAWGAAHLKEIFLSPGESPPSGYLGMLGLGAIGWLVIESWRRVVNQGKLPLEAWLILWIIVYAEVGGLDGIMGTFGFQLFRAATRYSIFILCIALMFGVRRLSAMKYRDPVGISCAALICVGIALWDQTPPVVSARDLAATAQAVASDREFTGKMEERLPAQAMVFQIPVVDFPESGGPGIGSYDHFRPYLYAHHLHFSFGTDKGRPRDQWQHGLTQMSLNAIITQLESYGFSALYVNLNSLSDKGAGLMQGLKNMGRTDMFTSQRGDLLCVLLQPSAYPIKPDGY